VYRYIESRVLKIEYRVLKVEYRVLKVEFRVLEVRIRVSSFKLRLRVFMERALNLRWAFIAKPCFNLFIFFLEIISGEY